MTTFNYYPAFEGVIRSNSSLGNQNHTQNNSAWSCNIFAEDLICNKAANGNFDTFFMSDDLLSFIFNE